MNIFTLYIPELYLPYLLLVHVILSVIFAVLISFYIAKRYVSKTEFAKEMDKKRYEEIENRSLFFKFLFAASLHKYNPISTKVYFFLFNFSLPVFGYIASLWIGYYLVHIKYKQKFINTNILNLDEFGTSFLKVERIFGEGSMTNMILNDDIPKSKKLKALSSLSSNISPLSLRIIKQTLSSKNDEIRMYGYAMINKIEKKLNDDINKYLEIYNSSEDDEKHYEAAKELAFSYWEMVYTELSHESLLMSL